MELPVVGFRVTGVVDAVVDGVTGTLVPLADVEAFAFALARYLQEPQLRRQHGVAGRNRAIEYFRRETIWEAWRALYLQLLKEQRFQPPTGCRSDTAVLDTPSMPVAQR